MDAGRILAVDGVANRLEMAQQQGAEIINFEKEDPVAVIQELTGGIGVDRAIDAVGVDAVHSHRGPASKKNSKEFKEEVQEVTEGRGAKGQWDPGDAPSQALRWAVESLAKAGTLSIIGVYPPTQTTFPIGSAMNKNLTVKMGNCNHRKYIPRLLDLVRIGTARPSKILTRQEPLTSAIEAYKIFSQKEPGWMKVKLAATMKRVPGGRARSA
jgi:threonine dehydrogenase-like Zn-dependent dehydrogenase